ncbi:DUF4197 domain-containing protein [Desulfobacula sp.]
MKLLTIKSLWMLQGIILIMLIVSAQVFAGNSWFNKGGDLLKSFSGSKKALSVDEIGAGLKEALKVGSANVVKQLGTTDGFNKDSNIHIPLPGSLKKVKSFLSKIGKASLFEDLELKLNRAAEIATPKAKQLFSNAISTMTMEDVKSIYDGPDDAATQYFKTKMSPELSKEMKPVIEDSLSQVGAVKSYDTMIKNYKSIPFVPDVKADLTDHVVEKGMDGIFYYMAKEEAAIRKNPVKRTTKLLKKVFTK